MAAAGEGNSRNSLLEGNTRTSKKQISPSDRWCFTWNNYKEVDIVVLVDTFKKKGLTYVFGREVGEENETPHLQGYVEAGDKMKFRPSSFGKWWSKAHWEKCKGTPRQNMLYAVKEGGEVFKSEDLILPRALAKITKQDLRPQQLAIADKYRDFEDAKFGRKVHWYWEEAGGWGKSVLATYMIDQMGALELSGATKDAFHGLSTVLDQRDVPIIIFDIPRSQHEYVSYTSIEKIKDGKLFSPKYEGGMRRFNRPHVLCFANQPPDVDKLSHDRWIVTNLSPPPKEGGGDGEGKEKFLEYCRTGRWPLE